MFEFIRGNILNYKALSKAIKGNDVVYNFAALASLDVARFKPLETANINIIGTINILLCCKEFRVKRFIHASSIYANRWKSSPLSFNSAIAFNNISNPL